MERENLPAPRSSLPQGPGAGLSAQQTSNVLVAALAVAAAVGGALAGCHPTGTPIIDPLETAVFAAAVTFIVSRSSRATWLVVGVGVVLLSRGWLLLPAVATIAVAFVSVFPRRSHRRVGAVVGALGIQVMLRWPPELFHGFSSLVAAALFLLCGVSAYRRSGSKIQLRVRLVVAGLAAVVVVLCLPFAIGTLLVRNQVNQGQHATRLAIDDLSGGTTGSASALLVTAANDMDSSSTATGGWWTLGTRLIPVASQHARLVAGATSIAGRVAMEGSKQAAALNYHRLNYHNGAIDLTAMQAMKAPASIISGQLAVATRQLNDLQSAWLIGAVQAPFARVRNEVQQTATNASLAVQAVAVLPDILGGAGPRHYFVAFMTPSESRGLDGFVGSYGLLTADSGHVSLTISGPIGDIESALPPGGAILTGPADYLARYGPFQPGVFPQDVTYSPDLPSVSAVLAQLYPQAGGTSIDGVLAIDPYGLAALLNFTGPIDVPGLPTPLTAANAAQELLTQQYITFDGGVTPQDAARHDLLQSSLQVAFQKLVQGSLPGPRALAQDLAGPAAQGRIAFWSVHPSEQPLLRRLGVDGSFPQPTRGDVLAVTTQNAGNNKIDAYLHTAINDEVTVDPGTGSVSSQVTVTLKNDATSGGLPPVVIASPAIPGLPPGTNRTWMTVYSPLALTGMTVDGQPAAATSEPELGIHAYSAYVDVPPSGESKLVLQLSGQLNLIGTYHLDLRLQPSVNPTACSLQVTASGDWLVAGTEKSGVQWTAGQSERQHLGISYLH
jgi:hypothetical protein